MLLALASKLLGEVAEWSIALDLKSSEPKGSEGSNPSLSVQGFQVFQACLKGVQTFQISYTNSLYTSYR